MTYSPPVQLALTAVDEHHYTTQHDGTRLPQTSAPAIIAAMLDQLDLWPGCHVMEIGTGSGYSTALISQLVGSAGHVTSIDIDPHLTGRARSLLTADGRTNITLITGDGRLGAPHLHRPIDRVVAWATVDLLPDAWIRQCAAEPVLVAPVALSDLAKTHAIATLRRTSAGLTVCRLMTGGFVEAHNEVLGQWAMPPRGVDASLQDSTGRIWWLSAMWLRRQPGQADRILHHLSTDGPHQVDGPLTDQENLADFSAYLLAAHPVGLTTAALGAPRWHIGAAMPTGAAFLTQGNALCTGDKDALRTLGQWVKDWRTAGRPGLADLRSVAEHTPGGWRVRVQLPTA